MSDTDLLDAALTDTEMGSGRAGSGGGLTRARQTGLGQNADPLAPARLRGVEIVSQVLDGPEMLDRAAFRARLGVSEGQLQRLRRENRVLELVGGNRRRYPEWQIGKDGAPWAVLPALFEHLHAPWAVHAFLQLPQSALAGLTPLQALERGMSKVVVEVAEGFVENPD